MDKTSFFPIPAAVVETIRFIWLSPVGRQLSAIVQEGTENDYSTDEIYARFVQYCEENNIPGGMIPVTISHFGKFVGCSNHATSMGWDWDFIVQTCVNQPGFN